MVSCTTPKSTSAPTAAPMRRYANEKGAAYAKSASGPAALEPLIADHDRVWPTTSATSITAPALSRMAVNPAASIWCVPSASRVSSEVDAKATSARSGGGGGREQRECGGPRVAHQPARFIWRSNALNRGWPRSGLKRNEPLMPYD